MNYSAIEGGIILLGDDKKALLQRLFSWIQKYTV